MDSESGTSPETCGFKRCIAKFDAHPRLEESESKKIEERILQATPSDYRPFLSRFYIGVIPIFVRPLEGVYFDYIVNYYPHSTYHDRLGGKHELNLGCDPAVDGLYHLSPYQINNMLVDIVTKNPPKRGDRRIGITNIGSVITGYNENLFCDLERVNASRNTEVLWKKFAAENSKKFNLSSNVSLPCLFASPPITTYPYWFKEEGGTIGFNAGGGYYNEKIRDGEYDGARFYNCDISLLRCYGCRFIKCKIIVAKGHDYTGSGEGYDTPHFNCEYDRCEFVCIPDGKCISYVSMRACVEVNCIGSDLLCTLKTRGLLEGRADKVPKCVAEREYMREVLENGSRTYLHGTSLQINDTLCRGFGADPDLRRIGKFILNLLFVVPGDDDEERLINEEISEKLVPIIDKLEKIPLEYVEVVDKRTTTAVSKSCE